MADERCLEILSQGVEVWNQWQKDNPEESFNLCDANLSGADLSKANLSGADLTGADLTGADLSKAYLVEAGFFEADLTGADLTGADLFEANLSDANLIEATLVDANLIGATLFKANLCAANLSGADLSGAYLVDAVLTGAHLTGAHLIGADLSEATFVDANFADVNLAKACLLDACLDGANLTEACLWETQLAGWSIKDVICEGVYWDKDSEELTKYGPGEFERLFSEKARIILQYEGGIDPIEFTTLPFLIQYMTAQYPGCVLRMQSIEEVSGGANAIFVIDELGEHSVAELRAHLQEKSKLLRENDELRSKLNHHINEVIPAMMRSAMQINIEGRFQGNLIGTNNGDNIKMTYNANDIETIRTLIDEMSAQSEQFPTDERRELEAELETIQTQLKEETPAPSIIQKSLGTILPILQGAAGGAIANAIPLAAWIDTIQNLIRLAP